MSYYILSLKTQNAAAKKWRVTVVLHPIIRSQTLVCWLQTERLMLASAGRAWKPPLLSHAQGFLCVRQLPCRSEAPSQCPLLYRECVLSLHGELLNHLLTTAWRELRQWLVNTPEWMKGLGIKWQDVLKEEQVVVEEGPAKPCRSGTSCVSLSLFFPLCNASLPSVFVLCLHCSRSFTLASRGSSLRSALRPLLSLHLWVFYLYCPHVGTTGEACSLTLASDNWHSWGWTFRSSPIHMYSEQRDKSHLPLPHARGLQRSWVNLQFHWATMLLLLYTMQV